MANQGRTDYKNSWNGNRQGAIVRTQTLGPDEPHYALERVIAKNYLDLNRLDKVNGRDDKETEAKGADITTLAQAWLTNLWDVPNRLTTYRGQVMHIMERIYIHHMEGATKPKWLTVVDMSVAWDSLQQVWAVQAREQKWQEQRHREGDESAPGNVLIPLPPPPEEQERRKAFCTRLREEFGLPAYREREPVIPEVRLTDTLALPMSGVASIIRATAHRYERPAENTPEVVEGVVVEEHIAPQEAERVGNFGPESVEVCAKRLELDLTPFSEVDREIFGRFLGWFWHKNRIPVEWVDIDRYWAKYWQFAKEKMESNGEHANAGDTGGKAEDGGAAQLSGP